MTEMPIAIAVEALSVFAGKQRLLGPISFTLPLGESLVIMGETGAGKSLLAQAILGTLPAGLSAQGIIHLNEQRIDTLSTQERSTFWGHEVAILPQEPWRALDPLMQAANQVREAHQFVAGRSRKQAASATTQDFQALSLSGAEIKFPRELSGGMAQRVAFAAATAADARILIADEPTKGLDTDRSTQIIEQLASRAARGGAVLAITHDVTVARQLGGEMLVLKSGNLVESGPTEQVLAHPSADYTRDLLGAEPRAWPDFVSAKTEECLLTADNINVSRGDRLLLQHISLKLHAGERVAIAGPSGIGKTSLLDVLAGLQPPASGTVLRANSVKKTGIQKLYQDPPAAFPAKVTLGTSLNDVARLHNVKWAEVEHYLFRLGIQPSLMSRLPSAVSGGELQRLSIARALTTQPAILLADEPTSRLDPITQRETLALIAEVSAELGIAVVLVTHDAVIAEKWSDQHVDLGCFLV